jgi:betaine-aldehyde dehydrogenase
MTVVSSNAVATSVAGSWIDGAPVVTGGGLHQVINPATGEAVAHYALATAADVDRAVASARTALAGWATATPVDRSAVLAKLAKLADEHADDLVAEEVSQTGKPVRLATEFDVPGSVDNIDFFAGAARHLEGKATAEYSGDHTSSIRREAVGVVGTITPWNYPLQMAVWKVLPALAAGCTVVIKPCELTPLTTLTLARLASEAGLPDGVFNVVTGLGADAGTALAGHRDVDVVTFTGSTAVGRKVMAAAAVHGHRTQLELGGKAPFVVFDDADLDAAIQGAVAGALINTGQDCTAATRAIVARELYDDFVAGVGEVMGKVVVGDPHDPDTDLGPLITAAHREKVAGMVARAPREGGRIVTGGSAPDLPGSFYRPTLIADVSEQSEVYRDEIFGPVLTVERFKSIEAACDAVEASPFALTGGLFSRSPATIDYVVGRSPVGNLYVNRHITGAMVGRQPFGGNRRSGIGAKAGGPDYVLQFVEPRVVSENTMRHGIPVE